MCSKFLNSLNLLLLTLLLNPNEAFHGNQLYGILIRNQNSRHSISGIKVFKTHVSPKIVVHLRQNSLILLRETGRSGGVSEQVYKEFDQAVEINDLLLVEDLIMVR